MDVLAFCLVLLVLAAFVAAPLYARRAGHDLATPSAALEARRRTLVAALRDLEIDHASGLLDDDAYERERGPLAAEAARISAPPGRRCD